MLEQRKRERHDLARDAVGVLELLDVGLLAAGKLSQNLVPAAYCTGPVACATSPRIVNAPDARLAIIRSWIGVRSCASSTMTWP